RAEFGRRALNVVRPRGVCWLVRSRGPLALILWLAAREGRLIRQEGEGLALLEAPWAGREWRTARALEMGVVGAVDRRWEFVLSFLPPTVLLGTAAAVAVGARSVIVVYALVIAAMAYIAILAGAVAVNMGLTLVRGFYGRSAAELAYANIPAEHW